MTGLKELTEVQPTTGKAYDVISWLTEAKFAL